MHRLHSIPVFRRSSRKSLIKFSDEIPDPITYYTEYVAKKNEERSAAFAEENRLRAFAAPVEFKFGHFLLHTLLEELKVKEVIDILTVQMHFQFRVYDGLDFIGESCKKYIELFKHCYEQYYQRDFRNVFWGCTDHYFEIAPHCEDMPQKSIDIKLTKEPVQQKRQNIQIVRKFQ